MRRYGFLCVRLVGALLLIMAACGSSRLTEVEAIQLVRAHVNNKVYTKYEVGFRDRNSRSVTKSCASVTEQFKMEFRGKRLPRENAWLIGVSAFNESDLFQFKVYDRTLVVERQDPKPYHPLLSSWAACFSP
jgi:hypothetical protein